MIDLNYKNESVADIHSDVEMLKEKMSVVWKEIPNLIKLNRELNAKVQNLFEENQKIYDRINKCGC